MGLRTRMNVMLPNLLLTRHVAAAHTELVASIVRDTEARLSLQFDAQMHKLIDTATAKIAQRQQVPDTPVSAPTSATPPPADQNPRLILPVSPYDFQTPNQPPQQYMQHQQQVHQGISSTQPTRRSSFGGVRGILNLNGSMSGSSLSTPPNSGMRDDSRAGSMGTTAAAAETTTPLEHFAKAQLAQEKLTRKLVAKIATLQETPWLSLTNVAVGFKKFVFCPVKDAVVWLAHRLSYAELMLIGMMIYISSPYLKPHVSQFLKQLRSSLLQKCMAWIRRQTVACRRAVGAAFASLATRLGDKALFELATSNQDTIDGMTQHRDAVRVEIDTLRASLVKSMAEVQHHANIVARIEAEQHLPAVLPGRTIPTGNDPGRSVSAESQMHANSGMNHLEWLLTSSNRKSIDLVACCS